MKLKKKYLFAIPILLATIVGFMSSTIEVKAETYAGQAIWPSEYVPNVYVRKVRSDGYIKYQQGQFIRRSEDNAFVYCLQPFVNIDNNHIYNVARSDYETYLNMSEEQFERINLLAYYGYGYGNHTSTKWYSITQVLIWRTAEPTSTIYFTNSLNGTRNDSLYASEIAEIESLVANHYKMPNFNINGTITLPLGQSITLNDSNNILNGFKVRNQSNVNASINGNSLTITATGVGDAKVGLSKEDSRFSSAPIVYFVEGSQNVFRLGSYDPLYSNINLKVVGGRVEITKRDKDTGEIKAQGMGSLTNAEYGIYDSSNGQLVGKIKTDSNAYAISDYLPKLGNFYLQEITPSEGYKLDNQKYHFTIDENNLLVKVNVYEEVITREFEITKVYASDKTQIMTPEVGVEFAIYDHNNNLVLKETSDIEGKIYFSLPYGEYTLKQLSTPSGFEKIEDYHFEVKKTGASINKVFSNAEITSRIKVIKVDDSGNNITKAGIRFKIKDLSTGKYVCQTVSYPTVQTYCEFVTAEDGTLVTPYPLNSGKYQLEELDQVVYGYVWNSTPLQFSIDEKANIISTDEFDAILELRFENKEVKGTIEINKIGEKLVIENDTYTYEEIELPNVVFGLFDESGNLVATTTSDDNGYAKFENLKLGKYTLKELSSSNGNVVDPKDYEIELVYKDQYTPIINKSFTLKNYLAKGNFDFSKTDISTGKGIANTKVEIYYVDESDEETQNKLIFSGITDKDGKIKINNLFIGKFYIVETEPATGYKISDDTTTFFEIKENGEIVKANMTNEKITGNLVFTKIDEDGNPLAGITINVYKNDGTLYGTYVTNSDGLVIIEDIEYGDYSIKEIATIEGYELSDETLSFSIVNDDEDVNVSMVNVKLPQTDLNDYSKTIALILMAIGSTIFIITCSCKKKTKNND